MDYYIGPKKPVIKRNWTVGIPTCKNSFSLIWLSYILINVKIVGLLFRLTKCVCEKIICSLLYVWIHTYRFSRKIFWMQCLGILIIVFDSCYQEPMVMFLCEVVNQVFSINCKTILDAYNYKYSVNTHHEIVT